MPVRLCLDETCPNVATHGGRCIEHQRSHARTHRPKFLSVYKSKRWRMLRKRVLFEEPICQDCGGALAAEVDHIVALEDGGAPYARDNVQALCGPCHGRKTWRERNARRASA